MTVEIPPLMRVPLVRTPRWRHIDTYGAFMLSIVAALFGYILVRSFLGESEFWLKLIPLGGAIVLTPVWAVMSQWRLVFGPTGSIALTRSELILDSPRWFRQPLKVPLRQIQEVSFEEWKQRGWWESLELNPFHERANVTIFFDPPLEVPPKTAKLFPTSKVNLRARSFRFVLARVENVGDLRAAFERVRA